MVQKPASFVTGMRPGDTIELFCSLPDTVCTLSAEAFIEPRPVAGAGEDTDRPGHPATQPASEYGLSGGGAADHSPWAETNRRQAGGDDVMMPSRFGRQ